MGSEEEAVDLDSLEELPPGKFSANAPSMSTLTESPTFEAGSCLYTHGSDYAHVTKGEASVHGWWVAKNGNCSAKAKVAVKL